MTDHGVKKYQAEKAYSAVHTAEHEHVDRQRRELLQRLTGAGLRQENLVKELSNRLAARVTIAAGPTGPYTERARLVRRSAAGNRRHGRGRLAELIGGWKPSARESGDGREAGRRSETAGSPAGPGGRIAAARTRTEDRSIADRIERAPAGPIREFASLVGSVDIVRRLER